jgi:thiol:disulfide interchange protein DsbC
LAFNKIGIFNMKNKLKTTALALALSAFSTATLANDPALLGKMQSHFPGTPINSAERVDGVPGLVEMVVNNVHIFYAAEDGSKIFIGHIFDPKTNTDLTQAKINELTKFTWSDLPHHAAITIKKGDGSREFAVFSDPNCGFCKRLEHELEQVDNYTMHVFLAPMQAMNPQAVELSRQIFCSADPAQAYREYMLNGVRPAQRPGSCSATEIDDVSRFVTNQGISGTPNLVGKNGEARPGYMPAAQLNQWLNENGR